MGLGILFSGQGGQYPTMFKRWEAELPAPELTTLSHELGLSLLPQIELSNQDLFTNRYAQPLLGSWEFLLWQRLRSSLSSPLVMFGYSLGELVALAVSAGLSCAELVNLCQQRANLMSNPLMPASGLLAVSGLSATEVAEYCAQYRCTVAIYNSPTQVILGGERAVLSALNGELSALSGRVSCQALAVEVAAHTPLLATAAREFSSILANYAERQLLTRLIAAISGDVLYAMPAACSAVAAQIGQGINFARQVQVAVELGVTVVLEIGPGRALSRMVNSFKLGVQARSIEDFATLAECSAWVTQTLARGENF